MTDPRATSRVPAPRAPADETVPHPGQAADADPDGLTTFSAALDRWKTAQTAPHAPPAANPEGGPGPRLLHDHHLPPAPSPALPGLPVLKDIAQAAADRARRLLTGAPLPETALTDAVHMAAALPGIDTTTAYRLNIDVGHWRDLVTAHRTAVQTTGSTPTEPA